ncbi:MAG: acetamidase/formamidase family protein [Chloroflexi bacterium]|nr:acetamidase/formamidase family protein [Chloroflexota bacterium]
MSEGMLHVLEPIIYLYTWGPSEPLQRIASGDSVTASTRDARGFDKHGNALQEDQKQKSDATSFQESNPLVGPIWVENAEPGDMLKVTVSKIRLNRDYAWSLLLPHFGALTGESDGRELLLNDPSPELNYEWKLDLSAQTGTLELLNSRLKTIQIPLHPFIGSIGVAPRFGRVETALVPGEYGGNMDCVETAEGAIIYFPIWVRGAYLSFGDVHAAQGDGEVCGVALETTADVTLKIEVIKNRPADWPRIENSTHIMVAGSARPLMSAVQIAHLELLKWLVSEYGFDRWEALQILSQVGTMRVGNIVDPNYTVVAKFPRRYLPR